MKKKLEKKFETNLKTKKRFFSLKHPPGIPECPQQFSVPSVQPFGRLLVTCIYTNVLFYYIDGAGIGMIYLNLNMK